MPGCSLPVQRWTGDNQEKEKSKMKRRILIALVVVLVLAATASVTSSARETIEVWWLEDGVRNGADGTFLSSWIDNRIPPEPPETCGYIELTVTGKAYHGAMEWFYNYYPLPDFSASPFVVPGGNGKFAVWARYTSTRSGLPILDKIRGRLTIDPVVGTAHGSYTQYSYIESCDGEAVIHWYPNALSTDDACVWYGGWTDYTVHGQE